MAKVSDTTPARTELVRAAWRVVRAFEAIFDKKNEHKKCVQLRDDLSSSVIDLRDKLVEGGHDEPSSD